MNSARYLVVLVFLACLHGVVCSGGDQAAIGCFISVIASIWIIPTIYLNSNYNNGPTWFIKPSGCNEEFYRGQGSIPPAFKDAYPKGTISVAGEDGANWWIDGVVGWRLFYAPGTGKHTSTRFGLCPSYFGHHSDVNCVNFRPDDSGKYTTADNVFSAMDSSYELSNYANFNISNDQPFEPGTSRNSMRLWFDEQWLPLSMQVKRLVVSDGCKVLYQIAFLFLGGVLTEMYNSNMRKAGKPDDNLAYLYLCLLAAVWIPTGLCTKAWVDTKNMETVSDPNNWQALFPYCDNIEVTSFMDHSSNEKNSEDAEGTSYFAESSLIWGMSIWYLILASPFTCVAIIFILIGLGEIVNKALILLGIKKPLAEQREDKMDLEMREDARDIEQKKREKSKYNQNLKVIQEKLPEGHSSNLKGRQVGNAAVGMADRTFILLQYQDAVTFYEEYDQGRFHASFLKIIKEAVKLKGTPMMTYPRFIMKISYGDIVELTGDFATRLGRVINVLDNRATSSDPKIAPFLSEYTIEWIKPTMGDNGGDVDEVVDQVEHNVPLVKKGLEGQYYQNLTRSCTNDELIEQERHTRNYQKLLREWRSDPHRSEKEYEKAFEFFAEECWLFPTHDVKEYLDGLKDDEIPSKV